ncbi:MAG: DEAD/DEAH box helicase [Bacteroidetes bacterium]|nr:DEAD/DEAH box helicase [Bacteroidota bacterium]
MTFENLNLIEPLTAALSKKGYTEPTPIQEQSIPHILAGKDIFGCAQTGTGKTAAFALPLLQLMTAKKSETRKIKALILAPTRELAIQISENFTAYGSNLGIKHVTIFGGVSQNNQTRALRAGVDVVVATPGRLLDLMNQGFINLQHIEYLILDEADRMLDMGFINDINKILAKIPNQRQTIFFSATVSPVIMKLAEKILRNPVKVSVTPVSSASVLVKQSVYYVLKEDKKSLLKHLLKDGTIGHALIFTRTKRGADRVAKELNRSSIKAEAIHGDKSQNARERALKGFKDRSIRILVATDIASRGIDVDKLTHVINYELPEQAETYVHRIGRTGRAGSSGYALSFCNPDEKDYLRNINKLIKDKIEVVSTHPFSA